MNFRQLEIVEQIAKCGSLLRAATALGLAQSVVSRQLSQLEQQWGERLFERTGRGMVLSSFGQLVFPQISAFLLCAQQLEETVQTASAAPAGSVRIGVVPSLAHIVVPQVLADIKAVAPELKLNVVEGLTIHLDDLLNTGRVDLAVVNRYGVDSAASEEHLATVGTYLICNPRHKYAKRPSVTLADLDNVPLVVPSVTSELTKLLLDMASERGCRLNIHLEAESLSVMKGLAASGEAMTLLPYSAVCEEISSGELAAVRVESPELSRKLMLASTAHHGMSRAARLVISRIRKMAPALIQRADHPALACKATRPLPIS